VTNNRIPVSAVELTGPDGMHSRVENYLQHKNAS